MNIVKRISNLPAKFELLNEFILIGEQRRKIHLIKIAALKTTKASQAAISGAISDGIDEAEILFAAQTKLGEIIKKIPIGKSYTGFQQRTAVLPDEITHKQSHIARMKETGNLYIETAEKSKANNANYYPSGIFRRDNSRWYWIGDYKQAFIFKKADLQAILEKENFKKVETSTSQGILIPIEKAKTICKRHLVFYHRPQMV